MRTTTHIFGCLTLALALSLTAGCGDDVPPLCDDRAVSSSTLIWRWLKTSDGGITVSVSRCSWSFLRDSSCAAERLRNHSLVNAIGRFDMVRCALAV